MFPICSIAENFAEAVSKRTTSGVKSEAIALIESLQPFTWGTTMS